MVWFYRLNGEQIGPISASELKLLYRTKAITADTLVRRYDMPDWYPLRQFVNAAPPEDGAHREAEMPSRTDDAAPALRQCTECGRPYAAEDLIQFDDHQICADCKPRLVQKLRQGIHAQANLIYAGFWLRFGAKFIDALILGAVNLGVGLLWARATGRWDGPHESQSGWFWLQAVFHMIGVLYTTFFLGRFGATPGKMVYGLKVVSPRGGAIDYPRALGRQLAEYLSGLILMLGYIMAAFDSEKRALHDRICQTRVVRR